MPVGGGRCSPGHVLQRQQRAGRVRERRDVGATVVDAEHPPADGGRDRLREARRLAAVPAGYQAGEGARPLGHGSATPRRVRVRRRARTKVERVMRCHARVVRRRIAVWVTVRRHGKLVRVKRHRWIRVSLLPHVVMHSTKRVGHGRRTSVSGWLGMPDGTALGGQVVQVLTAPDNGLGHFTAGGGRHDGGERELERAASGGTVASGRGLLRGRADARAERLGAGARGRAGEGEAAQHLARRVSRGAARCGSSASSSAATCRPAVHSCGCGSGRARRPRPTACRST